MTDSRNRYQDVQMYQRIYRRTGPYQGAPAPKGGIQKSYPCFPVSYTKEVLGEEWVSLKRVNGA